MTTRTAPPAAVRRAHAAWLIAVTAGVYETGLAIAHGFAESDLTVQELLVQLTVRGVVLGGAVVAAQRMRDGSNAARWALALVLGVLGLGSLLVGPAGWLAAGHGPADLDLSALEWVFASSRVLHVAAVVVATASMFTPAARAWFAAVPATVPAAMIGAAR